MKAFKILALGMVLTVLSTSCKKTLICEKGNGTIATEVREITGFTGVETLMSANVFIEESPNFEVKIETDENLLNNIKTTVSNGVLRIDTNIGQCIRSQTVLNVYIKAPNLSKLEISGSGDVSCNRLSGSKLDLTISGSGNMLLDSLTFTTVNAKISGSGSMRMTGTTPADLFEAKISGSGDINNYSFPVKHADLRISGSGNSIVYPIERLDVDISGSGDVRYRGAPNVLNTSVSGSGTVKPY